MYQSGDTKSRLSKRKDTTSGFLLSFDKPKALRGRFPGNGRKVFRLAWGLNDQMAEHKRISAFNSDRRTSEFTMVRAGNVPKIIIEFISVLNSFLF